MALDMSALGVGSGLNLGEMLDMIEKAEQSRLEPLKQKQKSFESKLSAYGKLQSALDKFQEASEAIGKSSLYEGVKVQSENTAFEAITSEKAAGGSYNIEVSQLARAQSLATNGQASIDDAIGSGATTITLTLGDSGDEEQTVDIELADGKTSLADIRNAINDADLGVNASIINNGDADEPYQLVLSSAETGEDSRISVDVQGNAALAGILNYDSYDENANNKLIETQSARNAEININGIEIKSQSNTVEDAIEGVTLELKETTNAPEQLVTKDDTEAVRKDIESFVKAYNELHKQMKSLTKFNGPDADKQGPLIGDSVVRRMESSISLEFSRPVDSGESDYPTLIQMGISLNRKGELEIDDDVLDDALASDLSGVKDFFIGTDDADGFADNFTSTLENISENLLGTAKDGAQSGVDRMDERMESMQTRIDSTVERYRQQFLRLDMMMSQLHQVQSRVMGQLGGLVQAQRQN